MHSFKCVPRAVSSPLSQIQQKIKYINYNKPQTQKTQHTGAMLLGYCHALILPPGKEYLELRKEVFTLAIASLLKTVAS